MTSLVMGAGPKSVFCVCLMRIIQGVAALEDHVTTNNQLWEKICILMIFLGSFASVRLSRPDVCSQWEAL